MNFNERESGGPCISVYFQDVKTPLALPTEKVVETALNALKSSGTESFYRCVRVRVCVCVRVCVDLDLEYLRH